MISLIDPILVFVVLVNLTLLGSSRLAACIRLSAAQGMAVGMLPLLVATDGIGIRVVFLALVVFMLKGFVFPRLFCARFGPRTYATKSSRSSATRRRSCSAS